MEKKINACISVISSRTKCIKPCLESLWNNFNHKYDYPVYVYYFDDIYDAPQVREDIQSTCGQNVIFRSIPYKTPSFLKEEELFYNRKNLWYVYQSFSIARKGYLHMCHYMSNYYGYPNTDFEQYDYAMSIDDESMFLTELPYNPFEVLSERSEDLGALKIVDQNTKKPHQGNFDTRVNLWNFIQDYIKKYNIEPKSAFIKNLLEDPNSDQNFHLYPIANSYVVKLEMFKSAAWKQWIKEVNEYGGIYKYRWGDNDINSLFYLIHYDHHIYDFKTVEEGYHNQGALRYLQDYAPSIKDIYR